MKTSQIKQSNLQHEQKPLITNKRVQKALLVTNIALGALSMIPPLRFASSIALRGTLSLFSDTMRAESSLEASTLDKALLIGKVALVALGITGVVLASPVLIVAGLAIDTAVQLKELVLAIESEKWDQVAYHAALIMGNALVITGIVIGAGQFIVAASALSIALIAGIAIKIAMGKDENHLSPKDVRMKVETILKSHVQYQTLTPELARRTLRNYIEALDPSKTYFLKSELEQWLEPTPELLQKVITDYAKEDFSIFASIHKTMLEAIERRNQLEEQIQLTQPLKEPQMHLAKGVTWAKTEAGLKRRLQHIQALQRQTAEKIAPENPEYCMQCIQTRRLEREQELSGASKKEQEQIQLLHLLKATASALDPHTQYFTPRKAREYTIIAKQRLQKIGTFLRDDINGFSIVALLEGSPASRSRLKAGDKIIAIDHQPIMGMQTSEVLKLMNHPRDTPLLLTVVRTTRHPETEQLEEEHHDIEIGQSKAGAKTSRMQTSYMPCGDGVVLVVHLHSFYQDTHHSSASDVAKALASFKKKHKVKAVVLDLRNNSGGLIKEAVAVSGLFLSKPRGVVVSLKDNRGRIRHMRNLGAQKAWDGPLTVLTNRASASSSEIVAQALQDYGRALVIGDEQTYGKGTSQDIGQAKISSARFYSVSGKSTQLVGVKPDIVVPGPLTQLTIGEQYSQFSLAPDQILSNLKKTQIEKRYPAALVEQLKENSQKRQDSSQKEKIESEDFTQLDLQLQETLNIMQDLLLSTEPA